MNISRSRTSRAFSNSLGLPCRWRRRSTRGVRPNAFPARIRPHRHRTAAAFGAAAGTAGAAPAPAPVVLRQDHPKPTPWSLATLWSIAGRFLQDPGGGEIWRQNPQLRNPNRIYPATCSSSAMTPTVSPQLAVAERDEVPLIKLSPEVRIEELSQPIPPVPRDAVESFLTRAAILSDAQWKGTPYIVADDDDQVVYAARDRVYARGSLFDQPRYQVFRPAKRCASRVPIATWAPPVSIWAKRSWTRTATRPRSRWPTPSPRFGPATGCCRSRPNASLQLEAASGPTGHGRLHHRQTRHRRYPDHPVQQPHRQSGRSGRHRARPCARHLRQGTSSRGSGLRRQRQATGRTSRPVDDLQGPRSGQLRR